MRTRTRSYLAICGLAALALGASACGSSGTPSSGTSGAAVALGSGTQGLNPGTGTPQRGGTLNLLGIGDVTYMDYNISYYTIDALGQRMWQRGLYAYAPSGKATNVVPDLATAVPQISNGGKTYKVTIRTGAQWNTSPARQVTAADAVLGLKRACNPVVPFGGLPDFESLIVGYQTFCTGFGKLGSTASAAAIKKYISSHQISGVTASGQTITYSLTQPASFFTEELQLDAFSPAPVESLKYVPASAASAQHTIADGPYQVQTYVPTKKIVFVRNPAWQASSDLVRKAYVNQINVTETGNETTNQQILQTNSASAGAEWDSPPPVAAIPGLVAQMQNHANQNFNLGPTYATNPYLVYNTVSPSNGGALKKLAVRQAISYAVNRAHLIQDFNGKLLSPPLTHVLPDGINGAQDVPKGYDPYPYNVTKAKSMLAAAGYKNGLTLKFLYRPSESTSTKAFQTLQADLAKAGIKLTGLGVPDADFYTKYLFAHNVAQRGVWDVSLAGWGPDWYGDSATSFFKPLFYGPPSYPPAGGSNYGYYNNPTVSATITKASSQASASTAATLWAQADQAVMKDAPFYPITQPLQPLYHASYVHNAVYVPGFQGFDMTNVWLSKPGG